ncbi:hypothetical protein [Polymorphospora sp. NPDC050346]|uniref:hypothetical protein n=1 Tax=Polymorphospora sp. NPDC050346 TaxID=3155780 RepID=UPI0033C14BE8
MSYLQEQETLRVTEKKCSACGETKPIETSGRDGSRKDGREPRCKACRSARHAATYVRKGHPTSRPVSQKHKPGNRYGALVLVERVEQSGEPRALFRCECGTVKALQINNVASGTTVNCADRANHPDPRRRDQLTYNGAHSRVKRERGSASRHLCRCGKQAEQWAYSHADYDQVRMTEGREAGKPYSLDPQHYSPMCRRCHARFDQARRRLGGALSLVHLAYWMATHDQAEEVAA